ncbi:hypothetical protein ACVIGA_005544 [Bradyrhizobium sp. USDA 3240]
MRVHSMPARSADSCAAFTRMTPATMGGHEAAAIEPFPVHHKAAAIPDDNLHPISALRTEDHHTLHRVLG